MLQSRSQSSPNGLISHRVTHKTRIKKKRKNKQKQSKKKIPLPNFPIFAVHRIFIFRRVFSFKGCGMGTLLVLVSPCFRENVVATCKIESILCSLDNLLQKNVIVFFFGNQISKWRSFEKRAIFDLLSTFFSHQGKVTKIPSAHISLTYVFCSPY